ncbi:MAG: hypothetical protein P8013_03410 [Candidatus Sulfobium sp.]|jgi:hypothetical protein
MSKYVRKMFRPGSGHRRVKAGERGIALVMVLVLSAISLAIMAGLVYMLTVGTQTSGSHKRYRSAVEAGKAGTEIAYDLIAARGNLSIPTISLYLPSNTDSGGKSCLTNKLNNNTATWSGCNSTMPIDPDQEGTYDWSFQLGTGSQSYTVYAKIVDTVEGNSAGSIGLTKGGVVNTNSGEITVMSRPYLYTLEVDSQRSSGPRERAKYSILYKY